MSNFFHFCAILLLVALSPLRLVAQQPNKKAVDSKIDSLINIGEYATASNVMVDYSIFALHEGDSVTALKYQIENCKLVEKHAHFFADNGLTMEAFLNNYALVMCIERDMGKTKEAIETFSLICNIAERYLPSSLPTYADMMSATFMRCTDEALADSVFLLQKALVAIQHAQVTKENVNKYTSLSKAFYLNRCSIGIKTKDINKLRKIVGQICDWHQNNHDYIFNLDSTIYKKDILDYNLVFIDYLDDLATHVSVYAYDYPYSIKIYEYIIKTLLPLLRYDITLSQKIAAYYAKMANTYSTIGNISKSKECGDKGYAYLEHHKLDNDYCNILNALASNAWYTNQRKLAAKLKFEEIKAEDLLGKKPDWGSYFVYIEDLYPDSVIAYNHKLEHSKYSYQNSPAFLLVVGEAYSKLMDSCKEYKDTAFIYYNRADSILNNSKAYSNNETLKYSTLSTLYSCLADYYSFLDSRRESYAYSKKALDCSNKARLGAENEYNRYYKVAVKASFLHDSNGIHYYLPFYYYGLEEETRKILATLGSAEADAYLMSGKSVLYRIPEWCYLNPNDTTCSGVAYDNALFQKGLSLRYETLAPIIESQPELLQYKNKLDCERDSIYKIKDDNSRFMALMQYEQKERKLLQLVDSKSPQMHWRDIQNALHQDECCVEFVRFIKNQYNWSPIGETKPHYMALVLDKEHNYPKLIDLFDEDELSNLYNLQPKSYASEIGTDIYNKVWGKLSPFIDNKKEVFFSPMGLLNLINIEMLTDSIGTTACEKFNLHRVSSTKQVLSLRQDEQILSIVTFGGIDYKKAEEHSTLMDSLNTRGNWSFLSGSVKEVQSIEKTLSKDFISVRTVTGKNATEKSFKALDGTDVSVIHIASHGFYITPAKRANIPYYTRSNDTQSIQDEMFYSGLIMSGGQKAWENGTFSLSADDGILSSYEISKMDLHNVKLVVLSACESGLGDNLYDGIYGLQRAFKKAGVQSLLMSLWKIDDASTADFMSLFYKNIAVGQSLQDSYRLTISEMRTKYKDPYFWASFVLLD